MSSLEAAAPEISSEINMPSKLLNLLGIVSNHLINFNRLSYPLALHAVAFFRLKSHLTGSIRIKAKYGASTSHLNFLKCDNVRKYPPAGQERSHRHSWHL